MEEWRTRHCDEVRKRVRPCHRAVREDADSAGLTLRLLAPEEVVDDVAELFAAAEPLCGNSRQQHPSPRGLAELAVVRHPDDVAVEPCIPTVEDRAAFEAERDICLAAVQSGACPREGTRPHSIFPERHR